MSTPLSPQDARRIALNAQGLLRDNAFGRGKSAVARALDALGYVQIDTIAVVERAHHHVLATRVPNYAPAMLDRLQLRDRSVFEYWFHAAAYLPMADYRYYLPTMDHFRATRRPTREGVRTEREVLARIRAEGALQSKDFEAPAGHRSGGWWDWKPSKAALDRLFMYGDLMVSHRDNFQKVYDLRERVLPDAIQLAKPAPAEQARFLALRVVRAQGVASSGQIASFRPTTRGAFGTPYLKLIDQSLNELVEEGLFEQVEVGGRPYYSTPAMLAALPLRIGRKRVRIISPFDNLVIHRQRTRRLFDLDYTLECYVPEAKRKFGYFALPVLHGDRMIARMDCKAHRAKGELEIHHIGFEKGVRSIAAALPELVRSIRAFTEANGCVRVQLTRVSPARFDAPLRERLCVTSP